MVIAIIGILVALLLPAIQAAREAARRAQCQSNIHNVALAVLNYESTRKVLPEGMTFDRSLAPGIAGLSNFGANWVIKILPYLEEQATYDGFYDPTNGLDPKTGTPGYTTASNKRVNIAGSPVPAVNIIIRMRGATIPVMLCPSDGFNQIPYKGHNGTLGPYGRGNYAANAGRAFLYNGTIGGTTASDRLNDPDTFAWNDGCQRGVMGPNVGVKLRQISDGTSKTFMLGEIRAGISEFDSRGVWALGHAGPSLLAKYGGGGDDDGPNFCGSHADDVICDLTAAGDKGLADVGGGGQACNLATTSPGGAECMSCHAGDANLQQTARSKHPGGVHMAMCDGSVQFISDDVETTGCITGGCCSAWDYMIASADGGRQGAFQNVTPAQGGCPY